MFLLLSWRNLWRNKKRTLIAAASVFFAVVLAVVMRSGQNGSYSYMIDSAAKLFTGHLEVQGIGYWENRSLDKSIILNDQKIEALQHTSHVKALSCRLEAFTLISYGMNTKVGEVVGINPSAENQMTGLKNRLVAGNYLSDTSSGILLAKGLADVLKVTLGDSIVLYGQGYHGQIAAAMLPVEGIVKLPFPEMNNSLVYLTLPNAQKVFSTDGRITSAAILIDNAHNLSEVTQAVRETVGKNYTVMTWDEMLPDLVQNIRLDNSTGIVMLVILYIVIAFGVFGTVMMMTAERSKEFGILVSVGMKKVNLIFVTTLETIFISLLGVAAGILGSIPIITYLHYNPILMTGDAAKAFEAIGVEPIMNFSLDPHLFLAQSIVVLIIALATAVYPVLFINKLEPAKAIHL